MNNQSLIERVFEFQQAITIKNSSLTSTISKSIIQLLEYKKSLRRTSKKKLMEMEGIGPKTADYLMRVFQGEDIESIVRDVPKIERIHVPPKRGGGSCDPAPYNGSWDNTVKVYEGD